MARKADPRVPFDYILEADRKLPEPQQTVFQLAPLSFSDKAYADDGKFTSLDGVLHIHKAEHRALLLRLGLHGWKQFHGEVFKCEEQEIAGKLRKVPTDATLSMLLEEDQQELADAISRGCALSESDRKNS